MGRAGDPETYEYDTEVLEASHSGECGCRSACELELTVGDPDKAFIAQARTLVPELVAEVERLRTLASEAAVGLGWYLNGHPGKGLPPLQRVTKLIAELEARP